MKLSLRHAFLTACLIGFMQINAQTPAVTAIDDTASYPYWIEMMQDPSANFYAVQSAFNTYWKDRPITKGCGWKPFKRWEYMAKQRLLPGGVRPAEDATFKAYSKYMQDVDRSKTLYGNWENIGPFAVPEGKGYKGLGRINAIGFHPTDANIIYIGAPAGGLWKSTDGGLTWNSNTDQLPTLGVSSVAVNPVYPETVYIGTGDRDATDAAGLGVMKSTDGGLTWAMANNGMGNRIVGRLLISPSNPEILFAATNGGIFKSGDGGQNWTNKSGGDFKDLVFKPADPTVMYATKTGQFYRSEDSGETWLKITSGISSGSRGSIGVSPANPSLVYFLLSSGNNEFRGLYRSTDNGFTFTEQSNSPNIMDWYCEGTDPGGQAWYDQDIAVDPINPDIIYSGGVNIWKSIDGGTTWQINAHWYGGCGVPAVHADHHIFEISPLNGKLYVGNDGGIYWTNNGGSAWHEISNGLAISQPYKLGQSATVSELVVNGYQDNGTSIYNGSTWYAIGGGDGMECAIDHTNQAYRYTTMYYGSIDRAYYNSNQGQIAGNGVNGITEDGDWVTPFILDAKDPNIMFVGYKNVWRSKNIKASNTSNVSFTKISDINTSNLTVLEQSTVNTNLLYASSSNRLYICTNAQADLPTWYAVTDKLPTSGPIASIETHPKEESTVYITQNDKVYRSADKGQTWTDISSGLPGIHLNTLVYYKRSPEGLYAGADAGIYYRDKTMTSWIPFSGGLPANGKITELEIYYDQASPANDRIKAATYGRGTWKSGLYYNTPVADFTAKDTIVPVSCPINFTDKSTGVPFQWKWTFNGAIPASSTIQNPENIIYPNAGTYEVKLVVSNEAGIDSIIKTDFITVSSTLAPVAGFTASPVVFCTNNTIVHFSDTSKYCPITWQWSFEPNTVQFVNGTTSNSQNPEVIFANDGAYNVALLVTNSSLSNAVVKNDYIIAGGYSLPFTEDFESSSFSRQSWEIYNPDNKTTWEITHVGGNNPGTHAAGINIFGYNASPGRLDRLISPALDFSALTSVQLSFEHAYAKRYTSISDSLKVYVSEDCGTIWTRVFRAGDNNTGNFATAPLTTLMFVPSSPEDWCGIDSYGSDCNTIDLSAWAGKKNIKIAFESYHRLGNNIYLDNISVSSYTGIRKNPMEVNALSIFPNPSKGILTLYSTTAYKQADVSIINPQGQVVFAGKLTLDAGGTQSIDITGLPRGVYFVRLNSDSSVEVEKIILE